MNEIDIDINVEFGELLDEAQKSLKRNLTFVGAVVRGYLRRGHKNDKWIKMIRSTSNILNFRSFYELLNLFDSSFFKGLESRFEAETNQMDLKPLQVITTTDKPVRPPVQTSSHFLPFCSSFSQLPSNFVTSKTDLCYRFSF